MVLGVWTAAIVVYLLYNLGPIELTAKDPTPIAYESLRRGYFISAEP
jgi:hypothetical protein